MAQPEPGPWSPDGDLVQDIDSALAAWWQGDYVLGGAIVHVADLARPLTPVAAEAEGDGDEEILTREVAGLVVVTQTCDIQRSARDEQYVQVAQLVELPAKQAAQARARRRPRYAHVPGAGEQMFADLGVTMTVEKAVIAGWNRQQGCRNDDERRRFNEDVRRKQSRFAFPDDVAKTLRPLRDELDKHDGKQTALGTALEELREIRVAGIPDWSSSLFSLYVYFILPPSYEEITYSMEEWTARAAEWLAACEPVGQVTGVDGDVVKLDALSADEYVGADQWDTDTFSD